MSDADLSNELRRTIKSHSQSREPVNITAGNSKQFLGREPAGTQLDVSGHSGIISYEPTELVLTARSGTPLSEIKQALDMHNQMLAFEPPEFSEQSTIGGCVASGLAGPRRPFAGSVRDHVLGMRIINGKGEDLKFGGQVMKNVAGYDVSRLMAGAMGTLGVILDLSLRVIPKPQFETTVYFDLTERAAISRANKLITQGYPISAACYMDKKLYLRLSGTESAVEQSIEKLDIRIHSKDSIWDHLRDMKLFFFESDKPIWRLSVPPATPPVEIDDEQIIDWGGAQRWLCSDKEPDEIRSIAEQNNGFADIIKNGDRQLDVYQPLTGKLRELHINVKLAFDPNCIFNPGRLYSSF